MSIEAITKKIIDDAKSRAAEIIKNAEAEAEGILTQGQNQAQQNLKDYLKREEAKYIAEANQILVAARLDKRNRLLNQEHQHLNEVFELVKAELGKLKKHHKTVVTREGIKKEALPEEALLKTIREKTSSLVLKSLGLRK